MLATPTWYSLYCAAMLECDRGKTLSHVQCAQRAIEDRVAELHVVQSQSGREVQDLSNALTHLGILRHYLGNETENTLWD